LTDKFIEKRITLDLLICGYQKEIHIPTFQELCAHSGGGVYYYNITENVNKFGEDLKYKFEKLHYDLNNLLTRTEYTDVHLTLRTSPEIQTIEVLGAYGKRQGNHILTTCSSDFNISYNLKFKSLKEDKSYHFQFVILYTEGGKRKKRIINYSIPTTIELQKVYNSIDNDCMSKLLLQKELSTAIVPANKNIHSFEVIKTNLCKRLLDCLFYYKTNVRNCSNS
jgi:hypothetical protein